MKSGFVGFIVCTLSWGTIGVLVHDLEASAALITFFRLALGVAVVAGWLLARGRARSMRAHRDARLMIAAGVVLAAHWVLQIEALQRLDVAAAILIVFLGPVLTTALAPATLGERLEPANVAALGIALAGIGLITVPSIESTDARGVAAAVGSAVLFAVLILMVKRLSERNAPETVVVWQQGTASVLLAPVLVTTSPSAIGADLVELLIIGVALTGVLSIVFLHALRRLKAQQASVLFYLEPASATVYAWMFLGQRPAATTIAGGVLIVLAGLVIIRAQRAVAPAGLPDVVVAPKESM